MKKNKNHDQINIDEVEEKLKRYLSIFLLKINLLEIFKDLREDNREGFLEKFTISKIITNYVLDNFTQDLQKKIWKDRKKIIKLFDTIK